MKNINDIFILNLIINNLIPQSCRVFVKKENDKKLNETIENLIDLWNSANYNINNIVNLFNETLLDNENINLNSTDGYVPFLKYNDIKKYYKCEVINVINIECEDISKIYIQLNDTQFFNNNELTNIKKFFDKHNNEKIYFGINDNNYNSFYLLSYETPTSIKNNSWIFSINKPLYKLNIYMIIIKSM
jgi:hypothetical protein